MDAGTLVAIIGTGVASTAVMVGALWTVYTRLDSKIEAVRAELRVDITRVETRLSADITRVETKLGDKLDLHLREDHGIRKVPQSE